MIKKKPKSVVVVDPTSITPQTPAEFTTRGWYYYSHQDFNNAAADFRAALLQKPDDPDTLYALGLTLSSSSQPQDAIEVFEKALKSLETLEDKVRVRMLTRLIKGHISRVTTGDWHLTK
jgi:tetratricopeptide (TPR) repeat protein